MAVRIGCIEHGDCGINKLFCNRGERIMALPKCKSVDECEFKITTSLDPICGLIGECGDKVIGDVPNKLCCEEVK